MKKRLPIIAIAFLAFSAFGASPAQPAATPITARKRADILKLIRLTHGVALGMNLGKTMAAQMIAGLRRDRPEISAVAIHDIQQAVFETLYTPSIRKQVTDDTLKRYAKYFTDAEIRGMIRFYRTPLGQKIVRVRPRLGKEALQAGEKLFLPLRGELIDRIRQYLQRDHINLQTLRPEKSGKSSEGAQPGTQ